MCESLIRQAKENLCACTQFLRGTESTGPDTSTEVRVSMCRPGFLSFFLPFAQSGRIGVNRGTREGKDFAKSSPFLSFFFSRGRTSAPDVYPLKAGSFFFLPFCLAMALASRFAARLFLSADCVRAVKLSLPWSNLRITLKDAIGYLFLSDGATFQTR